jgi:O-methyltransferase
VDSIDWPLIRRLSVMPLVRLRTLHEQAKLVAALPGDAAELGTYRGGSVILIANALPQKKVYGFESFEGLFNLCAIDKLRTQEGQCGHAFGDFAIIDQKQLDTIKHNMGRSGVCLVKGRFSDVSWNVADREFCFAHFDGDTYLSAKQFIEFFYPRLVSGGRLVFDDFRWKATPGVEQALFEAFGNSNSEMIPLGHNQIVIVKSPKPHQN